MFILIVKYNGKILKEKELESGVEYTIGRTEDNHIVLPEEHGISRKHLSFILQEEADVWTGQVKNLSRITPLSIEGQETEEGVVSVGQVFHVKNFEFVLQEQKIKQAIVADFEKEGDGVPDEPIDKPEAEGISSASEDSPSPSSGDLALQIPDVPVSSDGATQVINVGTSNLKMSAYLVVSCDSTKERFTLDNQEKWIIGRDEEADITIDNSNISRQHCKITKKAGKYYIRDLNSANGTLLNNRELSSGSKYPLKSGDMIYILDVDILFEIKNLALEKELKNIVLPAVPPSSTALPSSPVGANLPYAPPEGALPPPAYIPPALPEETPGVIVEMPEEASFFKQNKKRVIIYGFALILAGVLFFTMKEDKKKQPVENANIIKTGELAGLTKEEGKLVKRLLQSAQELYSQGKFEYCQSEIKEIYKITDSFRSAKQLQVTCAQAAENQKKLFDIERKRKMEEEAERKIAEITKSCEAKFFSFQYKFQLEECLNPAMELSPDDSRVQSLIETFDAIELDKQEQLKRKKERKALINSIASRYTRAKKIYKTGDVLKAMPAYQKFIDISKKYKELRSKHDLAKRELASIKKNFSDTNTRLINKCRQVFDSQDFKKAYYVCVESKNKVPKPYNAPAIELMKQARSHLEIQMKPFYEEAGLNEGMGNIDKAKGYWETILNKDVSTGLYYKRAKEKLDQY